MNIGRKLYYNLSNGNIIQDVGQLSGDVFETSREEDFKLYKTLIDRVPETVGLLQLEFNQHIQNFAECNGYRVNPVTEELEFSYPDPNTEPEDPTIPVFQKPLTEQIATLEQRTEANEAAILALLDFGL